jgi:hypothetical protein
MMVVKSKLYFSTSKRFTNDSKPTFNLEMQLMALPLVSKTRFLLVCSKIIDIYSLSFIIPLATQKLRKSHPLHISGSGIFSIVKILF